MARRGAPLDEEHFVACQAMAGIVLREVAEAIQECGETDGC